MIKKELSGLYNHTEIFRNRDFSLYSYNSINVVTNKRGKIICFDAVKDAEIKCAIKDAIKCVRDNKLNEVVLNFNGIEILIHDGLNINSTISNYLEQFNEIRDKLILTSFI